MSLSKGHPRAPLCVTPSGGRGLKSVPNTILNPGFQAPPRIPRRCQLALLHQPASTWKIEMPCLPGQDDCNVRSNTYRLSRAGGNPGWTWAGKCPISSELHHFSIVLFTQRGFPLTTPTPPTPTLQPIHPALVEARMDDPTKHPPFVVSPSNHHHPKPTDTSDSQKFAGRSRGSRKPSEAAIPSTKKRPSTPPPLQRDTQRHSEPADVGGLPA